MVLQVAVCRRTLSEMPTKCPQADRIRATRGDPEIQLIGATNVRGGLRRERWLRRGRRKQNVFGMFSVLNGEIALRTHIYLHIVPIIIGVRIILCVNKTEYAKPPP